MSSDFLRKFQGQMESIGKEGVIGIMKSAHIEVAKPRKGKRKKDLKSMLILDSNLNEWSDMFSKKKVKKTGEERNNRFKKQMILKTEEKLFMNKKFNNNNTKISINNIFNKGSTNKTKINHTSPSINSQRITIPIKYSNNIPIKPRLTNSSNTKKTQSLILPKIEQQYLKSQRLNPSSSLNSIKKLPKQKVLSKSESDLIRKVKQETNYISDIAKKSQILLQPHSHSNHLITNTQPTRPIKSILKTSRNFPNTSPSISKNLTLDVIQEEEVDPEEEPNAQNVSFINDVPNPQIENNKMSDIELLMQQRMSYQYYLPSNSVFKIKS